MLKRTPVRWSSEPRLKSSGTGRITENDRSSSPTRKAEQRQIMLFGKVLDRRRRRRWAWPLWTFAHPVGGDERDSNSNAPSTCRNMPEGAAGVQRDRHLARQKGRACTYADRGAEVRPWRSIDSESQGDFELEKPALRTASLITFALVAGLEARAPEFMVDAVKRENARRSGIAREADRVNRTDRTDDCAAWASARTMPNPSACAASRAKVSAPIDTGEHADARGRSR